MINAHGALVWLFRALFLSTAMLAAVGASVLLMILTGYSDRNAILAGVATVVPAAGAVGSWFALRDALQDRQP